MTIVNTFFRWDIVSFSIAHFTFDNGKSNMLKRQVIKSYLSSVILAACFLLNLVTSFTTRKFYSSFAPFDIPESTLLDMLKKKTDIFSSYSQY